MIELFCLIWIVSSILATIAAIKKGIEPSFWGFLFVISPIINTYIAIRYFRVDMSGFSEFWKQLNEK
jgi:hypothetical protein